jgi:hypothetical protein
MQKWLPLIRHASHTAWSKLRGEPLDCHWLRVAAEVLLLTYEDLAASGQLEPLPDISGSTWWTALHDRLGRTGSHVEPLERVLGQFGLSPHPRVLILVEGETELNHLPNLLAQFGLDRPEQVRVQQTEGSSVNPRLLARYVITPRIGQKLGDTWQLRATPTALVIAMDPEGLWATSEKRDLQSKRIMQAIREEVERQDGKIGDTDLDVLVDIRVWDEQLSYELANFSDDELVPVIARLATGPLAANAASDAWQEECRHKLQDIRQQEHANIDRVIGPLRITKPVLAEALWPTLLAKCEGELERDQVMTPVLRIALEAQRLFTQLSGAGYVLSRSDG